jgi:hypothetical protein
VVAAACLPSSVQYRRFVSFKTAAGAQPVDE